MEKLKLIKNKEFNFNTPIRSVKVDDPRSAKRLLSRLITRFQRNEIDNEYAKSLTYLLSQFIAINKEVNDFESLRDFLYEKWVSIVEGNNLAFQELIGVISEEFSEEESQKIRDKFNGRFEAQNEKLHKITLESIEEIKKALKFTTLMKNEENYESIKNLIFSKCRILPNVQVNKLIDDLTNEFRS